ncbi:hypothetical protein JYU34_007529 [Plutella xylostella]|uniref:Uncharacterized protein n=1 Tax=Plutella xylostella TaxID=51655 RepID=A0ABQ7QQN3_PLUXY|nr:hypothetical protein JYU34_007529 [Plutella xylostella]
MSVTSRHSGAACAQLCPLLPLPYPAPSLASPSPLHPRASSGNVTYFYSEEI